MRFAFALGAALAAAPASAAQINVEMAGPTQTTAYTGQASLEGSLSTSTTADPWNLITGYAGGLAGRTLSTTTGAATGVTLSISSGPTPGSNQASGSAANGLLDNFAASTATYTVTLSGLQPSTAYDLFFYGNNGYYNVANDANTLYAAFPITTGTTANNNKNTSNTVIATSNNYVRAQDYVAYAAFNNAAVTSSASGTIAFSVSNISGQTSNVFNGLQITGTFPVPEPGAVALVGLAACGLLTRRLRRPA